MWNPSGGFHYANKQLLTWLLHTVLVPVVKLPNYNVSLRSLSVIWVWLHCLCCSNERSLPAEYDDNIPDNLELNHPGQICPLPGYE